MSLFRIQAFLMLAVLAVAAGCRQPTLAERDEQERLDPAVQAAWALAGTGNVAGAEAQYRAIIRGNPDHARAHLDLAMVLMTAEEKPLKAIYHFMRFLELRPESEKREMIGTNIRALTGLMGGKVTRSRIGQLEQQVAALQAENEALRLGRPRPPAPTLPPGNGLAAPVVLVSGYVPAGTPAAPVRPRTYTVQAGDTLTRIAQRLYGDGAKDIRIFEANRGKLKSKNALQEGQVLVIPP